MVEGFTEDLISGVGDWPRCSAENAPEARQWWKRLDDEALPASLRTLGYGVHLDALGQSRAGDSRRKLRCRTSCAVCARLKWESAMNYEYLWETGLPESTKGLLDGHAKTGPAKTEASIAARIEEPRRDIAHRLLSPETYAARWRLYHSSK